ncbi:unnamed protein product [Ceutorhynchus assimilis]|uniref:Uncharacterized protein n=1 Tax=Ceutorhynchus assimilis TaxID=467358 RepID=A0A9N9Q9A9_9CUCU|nr:unnamed protein product [Ceutorhynchus assimilis]
MALKTVLIIFVSLVALLEFTQAKYLNLPRGVNENCSDVASTLTGGLVPAGLVPVTLCKDSLECINGTCIDINIDLDIDLDIDIGIDSDANTATGTRTRNGKGTGVNQNCTDVASTLDLPTTLCNQGFVCINGTCTEKTSSEENSSSEESKGKGKGNGTDTGTGKKDGKDYIYTL